MTPLTGTQQPNIYIMTMAGGTHRDVSDISKSTAEKVNQLVLKGRGIFGDRDIEIDFSDKTLAYMENGVRYSMDLRAFQRTLPNAGLPSGVSLSFPQGQGTALQKWVAFIGEVRKTGDEWIRERGMGSGTSWDYTGNRPQHAKEPIYRGNLEERPSIIRRALRSVNRSAPGGELRRRNEFFERFTQSPSFLALVAKETEIFGSAGSSDKRVLKRILFAERFIHEMKKEIEKDIGGLSGGFRRNPPEQKEKVAHLKEMLRRLDDIEREPLYWAVGLGSDGPGGRTHSDIAAAITAGLSAEFRKRNISNADRCAAEVGDLVIHDIATLASRVSEGKRDMTAVSFEEFIVYALQQRAQASTSTVLPGGWVASLGYYNGAPLGESRKFTMDSAFVDKVNRAVGRAVQSLATYKLPTTLTAAECLKDMKTWS